jgi:hypothetical protein
MKTATHATQKTRTFSNIDDQERAARNALAIATESKQELLIQLGKGKDVQDQLDTVEDEIENIQRQLARLTEARAFSAQSSTKAAKLERHAQVSAQIDQGVVEAQKLGTMCQDVLPLVATLRRRLAAISDQRDTVRAHLNDAVRASRPGAPHERIGMDMHEHLHQLLDALTLPNVFVNALHEAGLGRTGIVIDEAYLAIRPPLPSLLGTKQNPAEQVTRAITALSRMMETTKLWSANVAGIEIDNKVA